MGHHEVFRAMNDGSKNDQPWGIKERFVPMLSGFCGTVLKAFDEVHQIITTPLPLPYINLVKTLLVFFLGSFPFVLNPSKGWYANVVVPTLVAFALLGVDAISSELENPFGDDPNDLDVLEMIHGLESEVKWLLL